MREAKLVPVLFAGLPLLLLSAAAISAQPADFGGIDPAHEVCIANCVGIGDFEQSLSCLIGCDNSAAVRSLDEEEVTLSSEEYVARWGNGLVTAAGEGLITTAGACHDTTPCPSEFASCASWSSYSDCGDPFCSVARFCGDDCGWCEFGPCPCFGPALRQWRERFRVCFNAAGQSCTEYQRLGTVLGCGC